MKKNKKLFAILTLIAFMMTLMPVMAFAAPFSIIDLQIVKGNGFITLVATRDTTVGDSTVTFRLNHVTASGLDVEEETTSPASLKMAGPNVKAADPVLGDCVNVPVAFRNGSNKGMTNIAVTNPNAVNSNTTIALLPGGNATVSQSVLEKAEEDLVIVVDASASDRNNTPSARRSVITIVDGNANGNANVEQKEDATEKSIEVKDADTVKLQLVLRNSSDQKIAGPTTVFLWVEENGYMNQASDALVLKEDANVERQLNNTYKVTVTGDTKEVYAQFLSPGTYSIKASFDAGLANVPVRQDPEDNTSAIVGWRAGMTTFGGITKILSETGKNTITVTAPAVDTRNWAIAVTYTDKVSKDVEEDKTITNLSENELDITKTEKDKYFEAPTNVAKDVMLDGGRAGYINVAANTVAVTPVTIDVYKAADAAGRRDTANQYPVKVSTGSGNIELSKNGVIAGNDGLTLTTGYMGTVTFDVAGLREGEYKIYVTIGDYESTLIVKVGATAANDIQTIKFPSNPIATDTDADDYSSFFRIRLSDANGNIVVPLAGKDNETKGAESATKSSNIQEDEAKYVAIVKAPEANKVRNADLYLKYVDKKEYYTFGFVNGKKFEAEGDYEVRVVLENGKSVNIPFSIKKFDKAVSLNIEYATEAVELNANVPAPDIYFLDANNVMKKANNRVTVAATGYAVASVEENGRDAGALKIKNDEKYLGQTVTVSAVAEKENLVATTTLTVTDSAQSVKLDTNRGQVNVANRVGFKLVNSNGQAVALGSDTKIDEVTCIVTNVADPDAKVSFSIAGTTKADLQSTGTGVVVLSSNKETTATVQIMVKATKAIKGTNQANDNNTGLSTTYYTGTETFTFGAEADKSVVMTIGSKEIVANNVPTAIDVAPFIRDNRTFVPFRALVEAFGAEVAYDEATSTVTTKLDGKTVVMTVGSTVLTVNDETVTMDVAPYIVDDRVVVPVRFVGEAFGFTVEATQDADTGATASVVFYQK